ncbi:MAG: serine/threonine protein kinase [Myxococcales bacterium]
MKLLDFGLAKRSHAPGGSTPQTRASVFVGTPEYMAPEQAMGKAVGPYTDLYACGIVAFEMLTGRLPFERGSALEIAMSQVQDPAPAPSSYVEGLSPLFEELILELLEKAPERRPASAEQVRARLREILEELDAPQGRARAPAKPRSEATTDKVHRPRRGLWIALGAAVVLAAGGGLWIAAGTGATEPPPTAASTDPQPAGPARQPEPVEKKAPDEPRVAATAPAAPDSVEEPPKQPEPATPADQAVAVRPVTPGAAEASKAQGEPERRRRAAARQARTRKNPPAAKRAAVEAQKDGELQIVVAGWADVRIDGKAYGRAPGVNRVSLPPGPHVLELDNPYRAPYRRTIVIEPGKTLVHEARLTAR